MLSARGSDLDSGPRPTSKIQSSRCNRPGRPAASERRSKAEEIVRHQRAVRTLADAAARHGLTLAETAKRAGLRESALYNHQNGVTWHFTPSTAEKLAAVLPGTTAEALLGNPPPTGKRAAALQVRTRVAEGEWQASFNLPVEERGLAALPVDKATREAGAYAAEVSAPDGQGLYRDRTLLACVPLSRYQGALSSGARVLVQRLHQGRVEVTVRELDVVEGVAHLWARSHDRRERPWIAPWPNNGQTWRRGMDRFSIVAVVVMALSQEI